MIQKGVLRGVIKLRGSSLYVDNRKCGEVRNNQFQACVGAASETTIDNSPIVKENQEYSSVATQEQAHTNPSLSFAPEVVQLDASPASFDNHLQPLSTKKISATATVCPETNSS